MDTRGVDNLSSWYSDAKEDQEVETNMQTGQVWDLEGFIQTGDILSVVGGYNFVGGYSNTTAGDIFTSTDNDFGNTDENFGYEFVFHLDLDSSEYSVFDLRTGTIVLDPVEEPQNVTGPPTSSPWRYGSGGTQIGEIGTFTSTSYNDDIYGFTGGTHYEISGFDLSFLRSIDGVEIGDDFWVHNTMSCGNDNLMGQGTVPAPEPMTMLLFLGRG